MAELTLNAACTIWLIFAEKEGSFCWEFWHQLHQLLQLRCVWQCGLQEGSVGVAVASVVKDFHQTQQPTKEQFSQRVPHKYDLTITYTVLLLLHVPF